jgi:hypothetical protein
MVMKTNWTAVIFWTVAALAFVLMGCKPKPQKKTVRHDGWSDVNLRASYYWMPEYGDNPKPEILYFCPDGWQFSGGYSYLTGEVFKTGDGHDYTPTCSKKPAE